MKIEELKRLAEAATPGPWYLRTNRHRNTDGTSWGWLDTQQAGDQSPPSGVNVTWSSGRQSENNAAYIAAANPAAVLELIDYAQTLESTLRGAADDLKKAQDGEIAALRQRDEARQNDIHAMSWLADCRFAVGDDGKRMLPEFVEHLKDLKRQRDELLSALKDARELVEDWGAYAPKYMQDKHDLQGDLDKLDAAITKAGG